MGYTHSWIRPRELDREKFSAAAADCRRVCEASGVALRGIEGAAEPVFADQIVAFDGGCEWFIVQCICDDRSPERPCRDKPGMHFGFCKTEHLPYDSCVQACLIVFSHHLGIGFTVSSDGHDSDWEPARQLCQSSLGYESSFTLVDGA
jgi:hypothetical protein